MTGMQMSEKCAPLNDLTDAILCTHPRTLCSKQYDRTVRPFVDAGPNILDFSQKNGTANINALQRTVLHRLERLQSPTGAFTVGPIVKGRPEAAFDTPFATALVLLLLLRIVPINLLAIPIIEKAVTYLCGQLRNSPRMNFFGTSCSYPADVDDTVLVFEALERASAFLKQPCEVLTKGRQEVLSQVSADGFVAIWFDQEIRGAQEDFVVSFNVARYLRLINNVRHLAVERRLERLFDQKQLISWYYPSSILVLGVNVALGSDHSFFQCCADKYFDELCHTYDKYVHNSDETAFADGNIPFVLSALRGRIPTGRMLDALNKCVQDLEKPAVEPLVCCHVRREIEYRSESIRVALLAKLIGDLEQYHHTSFIGVPNHAKQVR